VKTRRFREPEKRITAQDRVGGGGIELIGMLQYAGYFVSLRIGDLATINPIGTYLDIQHMSRETIEPPIELLPARTISPTASITFLGVSCETPLTPP
jgi:hypothetical protein